MNLIRVWRFLVFSQLSHAYRNYETMCYLRTFLCTNRPSSVRFGAIAATCLAIVCFISSVGLGAITAEQRQQLKELNDLAKEAGKLFNEGKIVESAEKVTSLQTGLVKLLESKDNELQKETRRLYNILQTAHGKLELEGAVLEALPSWEELTENSSKGGGAATVSFKDDIAPWMITLCGNCHISKRSGDFSLATYTDLMKGSKAGKVLFAGSDKGNPLVEVIESGDMPRGGGKVSKEQLDKLRKWIAEGAKFDGPSPTAPLNTFSKSEAAKAPEEMSAKKPTGKETVSFARDIAPILMENCKGCHIAGRQAQANFRMDTFAQFLRGGDSGKVIEVAKPDDSLLVKKLKGEGGGQRMPAGGRPALSPEKIELISTWIREGAAFDGNSPDANIETIINQAWAAGAKHEELFARRQERALARWAKVLPNDEPATAKSDQVFVVGNVSKARVEELAKLMEKAISSASKSLDAPSNQPLVKGGIALFVLKSRYDYGEFGRMTESRELPKEWQGHWQANPLDVYAVMADDRAADLKHQSALVLQMVSGAYLGSFNGVPTWFAEGVARNLVVAANRASDPRVKLWQQSLPAAMQKIDKPETLLEGRVDEESAGLVGMSLTSYMMERSRRRQFDMLLKQLRDGKQFDEAVTMSFAAPKIIVKNFLGK